MVSLVRIDREYFGCSLINCCCGFRCNLSAFTCCCCDCKLCLDISNLCFDFGFLCIYICLRCVFCECLSSVYHLLKVFQSCCWIFIFIFCIKNFFCLSNRCCKFCKVCFTCSSYQLNIQFIKLWSFVCVRCCKNQSSCSCSFYFNVKFECLHS